MSNLRWRISSLKHQLTSLIHQPVVELLVGHLAVCSFVLNYIAADKLSHQSDEILIFACYLMGQKLNLHINMGKLFCLLQEKLEPFVFGYELIVAAFRSFLSGLCLCRIWNNIIKRYLDFIMRAWLWGLSPWRPAFLCFCESWGLMKARNKRQIFCMCKWPVTSSCYQTHVILLHILVEQDWLLEWGCSEMWMDVFITRFHLPVLSLTVGVFSVCVQNMNAIVTS